MKTLRYLLATIAGLAFVAAALAQTLEPVAAGGSGLWPLVIVAIVAAVGVGLYLWHKRNPKGADAALVKAKDDASELAHKVADALATMTKTMREQAMVIASPPVQASINAGPPVAPIPTPTAAPGTPLPAAQNAPESTQRASPAPSPQPVPTVAPQPAIDADEFDTFQRLVKLGRPDLAFALASRGSPPKA